MVVFRRSLLIVCVCEWDKVIGVIFWRVFKVMFSVLEFLVILRVRKL